MPNDFSLALNFAQQAKFVLLSSLAVDALGNIWVTNFFGDPLSELTVASAYNNVEFFDPPSAELGHAITVALDDSNNVFVTNNLDHFSVSELTAASDYSAGFNFAPASAQFMRPAGIAIDTEGNLWVANEKGGSSGTGSISELIAPNYATDAANFSPAGANFGTPVSIALDAEGNVFVTNTNFNNNNSISELTAASGYETGLNFAPAAAALRIPSGISLDISNNIWVGGGNGVSELIAPDYGTNGAIFALPGVGSVSTTDPALDGSGNVWVPVSAVNGMSELTVASGYTNGITLSPPGSNISTPCCTAIDESGNLWNANLGTRSVTEIIGVAVPVRTPHKPGGPVLP